ncbi:hypothetical protein C8F04DRAFT_1331007 [Mycena alexandri]|uniref:Uncharacterized protein n=1 Tax=Mycena alexandri TaxID=1745969 RepID=A0AAD6S2X2_9AGAR|nr:hypothetical protein C8F04DRAFT_1331007 [Mycena alexandri]
MNEAEKSFTALETLQQLGTLVLDDREDDCPSEKSSNADSGLAQVGKSGFDRIHNLGISGQNSDPARSCQCMRRATFSFIFFDHPFFFLDIHLWTVPVKGSCFRRSSSRGLKTEDGVRVARQRPSLLAQAEPVALSLPSSDSRFPRPRGGGLKLLRGCPAPKCAARALLTRVEHLSTLVKSVKRCTGVQPCNQQIGGTNERSEYNSTKHSINPKYQSTH